MEMAGGAEQGFSTFLQLERAARHAEGVEALAFTMVNETRRLLEYRQAVLVVPRGRRQRVSAISGISLIERNAPMVRWVERMAREAARLESGAEPLIVEPDALPVAVAADWRDFAPASCLWCPLVAPGGRRLGALWLTRDRAWSEADRVLMARLCDAYAHAWAGLIGRRRRPSLRRLVRPVVVLAMVAALMALLAVPVRQSVLAPATVVARDAQVVAAPLDGVIAEIAVRPNQPVEAGDLLFRFDDTALRSRLDVAERSLEVARAELRRASQGAFESRERSAEVGVLEAQVALRESELAYARELMGYVEVRAERDGIAVLADADEWIGRPVTTGERVLEVADPASAAIRIDLPVADAIALEPGAAVELFPDVDPLAKLEAVLVSASYEAALTPEQVLAYRVEADFVAGTPPPRIGLRGTGKIYAGEVPLALYIFRRPLAALRQWIGF